METKTTAVSGVASEAGSGEFRVPRIRSHDTRVQLATALEEIRCGRETNDALMISLGVLLVRSIGPQGLHAAMVDRSDALRARRRQEERAGSAAVLLDRFESELEELLGEARPAEAA